MTTDTLPLWVQSHPFVDLSTTELYNVGFKALCLNNQGEYDAAMIIARHRFDDTLRYFQTLQGTKKL